MQEFSSFIVSPLFLPLRSPIFSFFISDNLRKEKKAKIFGLACIGKCGKSESTKWHTYVRRYVRQPFFSFFFFLVLKVYRLCQKKLYNFQSLIAEKVNKAQQQLSGGQNIIFLCVRRFLNGIIPWSGVKVIVHRVMSGKNKVGHFRHYCESHGSSPIGETHSDLR